MTTLITCVSTGKGTWSHVSQLMNCDTWFRIILVTNDFGKEKFTHEKPHEFLVVDENLSIVQLRDTLVTQLQEKRIGDVAVNLYSGSGKEHMALLSALLRLGVGIRFVIPEQTSVVEI